MCTESMNVYDTKMHNFMYPALGTESKMINPGFQSGWEGVTEGERHCRRNCKWSNSKVV